MRRSGVDVVSRALASLGVQRVFGLPGTQNIDLCDALRRANIPLTLATHEAAAAFMAQGYARASGRLGVLVTIPGPGFAWAVPGLAEARLDSVPLLHLTVMPARGPGRAFQLQSIDQRAIAAPLVKHVFDVERAVDVDPVLHQAAVTALGGQPGPVVVQLSQGAMAEEEVDEPGPRPDQPSVEDSQDMSQAIAAFADARRVIILAGQGALPAAASVQALAERCVALVLTTPSGRGVIPEDHPLALAFDSPRGDVAVLNELLASADLVLVLGCKLGHNGSVGFQLRLPTDRVVHVDSDPAVLQANYDVRFGIAARVEDVVRAFADVRQPSGGWGSEATAWRNRVRAVVADLPEPVIHGVTGRSAAAFFGELRAALPRDAMLVLDSGLHQVLARRYFDVLAPQGLLFPSDLQSMGYGLPAAIGACLAAPARQVVALIGDGGFAMTGLELMTAVRERLPLTVIVFNDNKLNLIRLQQLQELGHESAVSLHNPDFATLAAALDVRYALVDGSVATALNAARSVGGPGLVEVRVGDGVAINVARGTAIARNAARAILPRWFARLLRRLLGRRSS